MCVYVYACSLTLMKANDVRVPEGRGDLNLSLDVNSIQVVSNALLPDRFDRHLKKENTLLSLHTITTPNLITLVIKCG